MLIIFTKVVNCGHPKINGNSVTLVNFSDPALREASVGFSCSENFVLIGPDSAKCMDNGQWEPDPREVKCKGAHHKDLIVIVSIAQPIVYAFLNSYCSLYSKLWSYCSSSKWLHHEL